VNLNGIANEIGDAVVFTSWFVQGLTAFTKNVEMQTEASDVNQDGIPLTVADLIRMVEIIIGDATPYSSSDTVEAESDNSGNTLSVGPDVPMSGAFVRVIGEVTPTLLAPNMEMIHRFDGVQTRILIHSFEGESFTGDFLQVDSEVVYLELATHEGKPVIVRTGSRDGSPGMEK